VKSIICELLLTSGQKQQIQEVSWVLLHITYTTISFNVFICLEELHAAHTAEYIKGRLLNVCENRNITVPKIDAFITNNGVNITKASAELVGKSRNLPCFSHTLNLVASKVCDIENIAPLVSSVKAIVPFFRRSVSAAELRKLPI
jgi:hypothetical protein